MVKLVALSLLVVWICVGVLQLVFEDDEVRVVAPLDDVLGSADPTVVWDSDGEAGGEAALEGREREVGLAIRAMPAQTDVADTGAAPALPGWLPGWLRKVCTTPAGGWADLAAVLEAFSRIRPLFTPENQALFLRLAQQGDLPQDLRFVAAFLALGQPGEEAQKSAALYSALWSNGEFQRGPVKVLLEHLEKMGTAGRVYLPSLLALEKRPFPIRNSHVQVLRAGLAIAPDDPRVRDMMLSALGRHGKTAEFVHKRLLDGTPGDRRRLISLLESASGWARINGIRFLLEAGTPASEVGYLLVAPLQSKKHGVRRGAVLLLPRSGLQVADVAPVIEALFASQDKTCWLTGIEALGALGRMSGGKRTVVDLLFVAARLPSTKVRIVAVQTLLMYDGERRQIIAILADLLNDSEPKVRREAVDGLGELSAHEESARRYLQAALGDSDQTVREVAQYWLTDEDADEGG